ncbi:MAG TPA: hypothetical protein VLB90_03365 [Pseudomonadales bacterium]|nr:hypothetical protein [Pseudomonadales bacterium]
MKITDGTKVFFSALIALLLVSCAAPEGTDVTTEPAVEADRQYMCVSKVYLSDLTKAFLLPAAGNNKGSDIQAGKMLDKAVQEIFWTDSSAAMSGRALPVVTLGFDGATGVYTDSGKYYAQISLQFQIFKPTGQSYMDLAVGQSAASTGGQAASEKVVKAAMKQALHRLESILVSADICRPM